MNAEHRPIGQRDTSHGPRFAGPATFALLPRADQVPHTDIAVVGVPFDSGTSFRPGARFGPTHIREHSRQLHPYHQLLDTYPFRDLQVADAGDLPIEPFDIDRAVAVIEREAQRLGADGSRIVALGGDHTVALPLLRAAHSRHGTLAVLHFDAHLDTWDTLHGASIWHGSPFRRAAEEGLMDLQHCQHVGIRAGIYDPIELVEDQQAGFATIRSEDFNTLSLPEIVARIRHRLADRPIYISIDIDVLDPAHAPATGTPEVGGITTRELFAVLRGLAGLPIIGGDIVEVAPAYDHAGVTGLAAAHTAWELITLMTMAPTGWSTSNRSRHI